MKTKKEYRYMGFYIVYEKSLFGFHWGVFDYDPSWGMTLKADFKTEWEAQDYIRERSGL